MSENLTTAEVAELFRTSPETVRYWRHVGRGPKSFKIGRRVLYAREEVEALLPQPEHVSDDPSSVPPWVRDLTDRLERIEALLQARG